MAAIASVVELYLASFAVWHTDEAVRGHVFCPQVRARARALLRWLAAKDVSAPTALAWRRKTGALGLIWLEAGVFVDIQNTPEAAVTVKVVNEQDVHSVAGMHRLLAMIRDGAYVHVLPLTD